MTPVAAIDRYAVVGHPVAHSRSPEIHALFAAQTAQALVYERLLAPLDGFASTLRGFFARGGRGLNITVPFKVNAYETCQRFAPRARFAGAVNTVWVDEGLLYGDNTDGVGFVRDVRTHLGVSLSGAKVLVLGAGGAARGLLGPLLDEAPAELAIVNRTRAGAHDLAALAQDAAPATTHVRAVDLDAAAATVYDVVVNATSASLGADPLRLAPRIFGPHTLAYDLVYSATSTPFLDAARAAGAGRTADGLGMLVEQAAESFWLWRGVRPETGSVLAAVRESMRAAVGATAATR